MYLTYNQILKSHRVINRSKGFIRIRKYSQIYWVAAYLSPSGGYIAEPIHGLAFYTAEAALAIAEVWCSTAKSANIGLVPTAISVMYWEIY